MRTICVVTATRAEYGLLRPVVQKLAASSTLQLQLVATGRAPLPAFGRDSAGDRSRRRTHRGPSADFCGR